jgi:hypothetical protein
MPSNFQVVLHELGSSCLQFVKCSPRIAGHVMANVPRVIKRVLVYRSNHSQALFPLRRVPWLSPPQPTPAPVGYGHALCGPICS